jgi:glycosyltransferase involved in cell wall biosynthesis
MLKIGIDAGATTSTESAPFGNNTFTKELLSALGRVDSENEYTLYTQTKISDKNLPQNFAAKCLMPLRGWMKLRLSVEEFFHPKNIFLALNQSAPLFTFARKIYFLHGLSWYFFPQYYTKSYRQLRSQLNEAVKRSHKIVVSSARVKKEILDIFPKHELLKDKIVVLSFGVPVDLLSKVTKYRKKKILLFVGMDQPIKDIPFLLEAFSRLITKPKYAQYILHLVGPERANYLDLMLQLKIPANKVIFTPPTANKQKLIAYYHEAECLLSASHYESFNLPILEALSQNTKVVTTKSACISELRKYVQLAEGNIADFVRGIKRALKNNKEIDVATLQRKFSWEKYAEKLIKIQNTVLRSKK